MKKETRAGSLQGFLLRDVGALLQPERGLQRRPEALNGEVPVLGAAEVLQRVVPLGRVLNGV